MNTVASYGKTAFDLSQSKQGRKCQLAKNGLSGRD
jgi:hypothetical protein